MKSLIISKKTSILQVLFILAVISISIYLGTTTLSAKKRPTQGQIAEEYQEVLTHLKVIAQDIHPSGSQQIDKVREYIISEVESLGYDIEVEPLKADGWDGEVVMLNNLLVHIDQKNTDESIMFVSHYDGTLVGPAAADDGIGVASMLTSIKYLSGKSDIKNDIYFLFTDGEELGMEGANYFVKSHANLKENVKLVINLEAKGNDGALVMFQTSDNNRNIIKMLQKSLTQFTGFAFAPAVYGIIDSYTDLSEFLDAGWPGINFAVVAGNEAYHMPEDTYENINKDTGYMYYNTCRNLIDALSTEELSALKADEDAYYFTLFQSNSIVYSKNTAYLTQIILCVSVLVWVIYLIYRKQVKVKKLLLSNGLTLITIGVSSILVFVVDLIMNQIMTKSGMIQIDTLEKYLRVKGLSYIIIALISLCLAAVVFGLITRPFMSKFEVLFGTMPLLVLCVIATMICCPSISYLFTAPLLVILLYSFINYVVENRVKRTFTVKSITNVTLGITIFTIIVIVLPAVLLIYQALLVDIPLIQYGYILAAFLGLISCCIMQVAVSSFKQKTVEENI